MTNKPTKFINTTTEYTEYTTDFIDIIVLTIEQLDQEEFQYRFLIIRLIV